MKRILVAISAACILCHSLVADDARSSPDQVVSIWPELPPAWNAPDQPERDTSLHVFASGGHGFGGRVANRPTDAWRDLCATWMRSQGWLRQ